GPRSNVSKYGPLNAAVHARHTHADSTTVPAAMPLITAAGVATPRQSSAAPTQSKERPLRPLLLATVTCAGAFTKPVVKRRNDDCPASALRATVRIGGSHDDHDSRPTA